MIGALSGARTAAMNRDRTVVLLALAGVTALAWLYLIRMSADIRMR